VEVEASAPEDHSMGKSYNDDIHVYAYHISDDSFFEIVLYNRHVVALGCVRPCRCVYGSGLHHVLLLSDLSPVTQTTATCMSTDRRCNIWYARYAQLPEEACTIVTISTEVGTHVAPGDRVDNPKDTTA
jgi:hypothetical protein